jgi:hypothetical protein
MNKWTKNSLEAAGYKIENARITNVSLNMEDHGVLTSGLTLDGGGWGACYGGYVLGKGYLGAKKFEGSAAGMESIMRIMDVVGCSEFTHMKNMYIRVASKGWGSSIKIIGNIIKDQWFDYESFFEDYEKKQEISETPAL